jgi:hypothetical protein
MNLQLWRFSVLMSNLKTPYTSFVILFLAFGLMAGCKAKKPEAAGILEAAGELQKADETTSEPDTVGTDKLVHRFLNNCAFGIACAMISSWHGSLNLFCCKLMKLFTLNHCFDAELWKTVSQEDAELCCSRHKA